MSTGGVQLNVLDPNSLGDLKRLARNDPDSPETLRAASKQFEAMFLQMVLKSMRDATPANSMFDSDQTRMYQGLLDQQLALNLAQGRGTGLSDVIYRQLGGKPETFDPIAAFAADNGTAGKSGFDLSSVIVGAANVAARLRFPESTAGLAATDEDSGIDMAALATKLDDAIRAARDAGGAISERIRSFVDDVWPHALEASRKTGIPPQFMIAQAALETGWGDKVLRRSDGSSSYNLFNIKAGSSWKGDTVAQSVTEYAGTRPYSEDARFRAYASYAEAFRDYADLLSNSPRYATVLGQTDASGFARSLQQAGYATDPMYADKLTRIIGGSTLRGALAG